MQQRMMSVAAGTAIIAALDAATELHHRGTTEALDAMLGTVNSFDVFVGDDLTKVGMRIGLVRLIWHAAEIRPLDIAKARNEHPHDSAVLRFVLRLARFQAMPPTKAALDVLEQHAERIVEDPDGFSQQLRDTCRKIDLEEFLQVTSYAEDREPVPIAELAHAAVILLRAVFATGPGTPDRWWTISQFLIDATDFR